MFPLKMVIFIAMLVHQRVFTVFCADAWEKPAAPSLGTDLVLNFGSCNMLQPSTCQGYDSQGYQQLPINLW